MEKSSVVSAPVSRRGFLIAAAAGLTATAQWMVTRRWGAPSLALDAAPPAATLDHATFSALRGQAFRVSGEGAAEQRLTLTAVDEFPCTPIPTASGVAMARCAGFSLLFTGDRGRPLAQGTYWFAHAEFGRAPIFIVPLSCAPDGQIYEAVFTRL